MELLQLQYFQVIARTQNISAAAEQLHISQPSLSQLLKRLEQEAGTPLFDRKGKRIVLNVYGSVFLKYIEEVFTALNNATLEIQTLRGTASKTVNLSMLSASMLLPDLYREIKQAEPSVLLHILQADQEHPPEPNELIISSDWQLPADTSSCYVLLEEEIQLALPREHPLLARPVIRPEDLTGEPFISLSPGRSLTRILAHYFTDRNFRPNVTTYIDNPDIMRKLLAAQAGLAFVPTLTWRGLASSGIQMRQVETLPMRRFLLLRWNPKAFLTPSVVLCRDVIIRYFATC
ncbi:MAG: LysR family transcriptional regulator [Lachnospiraceae bacterium]|nr:LysR family transcriptional regulator [Lachnospiraceae bacterium]